MLGYGYRKVNARAYLSRSSSSGASNSPPEAPRTPAIPFADPVVLFRPVVEIGRNRYEKSRNPFRAGGHVPSRLYRPGEREEGGWRHGRAGPHREADPG